MSIHFLLDTNIISEPLRPKPNSQILEKLRRHKSEIAIAAVVWHELWFGCHRLPESTKRTALRTYLNDVVAATMPVLPYAERAAEWHAAERARLVASGKTPTFVDGQIAAIAHVNELTLVTLNVQDSREFSELSMTNWAN